MLFSLFLAIDALRSYNTRLMLTIESMYGVGVKTRITYAWRCMLDGTASLGARVRAHVQRRRTSTCDSDPDPESVARRHAGTSESCGLKLLTLLLLLLVLQLYLSLFVLPLLAIRLCLVALQELLVDVLRHELFDVVRMLIRRSLLPLVFLLTQQQGLLEKHEPKSRRKQAWLVHERASRSDAAASAAKG